MPRRAVGPGVGRAGDPARVADDDRPAVARRRLPRPARRDPPPAGLARSRRVRTAGRRRASARTSGSRAIASSSPASSAVRGTIESTSRYSAGAWSLPPIGPRPSRRRHAHPGRRVRVGRAAGRGVVDLEPEPPRDAPGRARRAGRSASSFSIGRQRDHDVRRRPSCRATSVAAASSRIAASAASRPSAVVAADVDLEVAALGDDVRPRPAGDPADVDGHARPAAVERVQVAHDARRLEDRVAALLGLDARRGRRGRGP